MAEANKTLITRAEMTSVKVGSRVQHVLDGYTYDVGATGIRDLSQFRHVNFSAGRILAQRVGRLVTIYLVGMVPAVSAASPTVMSQDRTNTGNFFPPYLASGRGQGVDVEITTAGQIIARGAQLGVPFSASISYITDKPFWQGSLPGVADGDTVPV